MWLSYYYDFVGDSSFFSDLKTNNKADLTTSALSGVRAAFHCSIAGQHLQQKNPIKAGDMVKPISFSSNDCPDKLQ